MNSTLISEAFAETERASRYLVQLCQHVHLVAHANPHMQAQVQWSGEHGVIDLGLGRCSLRADADGLRLRAEAPDAESLRQLEQRIAGRLEQIGRRDHLSVTWIPVTGGVNE
ncbi:MAG TPA: DUF2218 domain-containing protein [Micromonosporaceae bacterium]|nr:DUF2218 domain-containing protein [Micromonosporaceae bacterium]HCU51754.1 DUF2218 domain-containing protein [Micromonosporaceae bacterium]